MKNSFRYFKTSPEVIRLAVMTQVLRGGIVSLSEKVAV
jgi:hypothetical protein